MRKEQARVPISPDEVRRRADEWAQVQVKAVAAKTLWREASEAESRAFQRLMELHSEAQAESDGMV